MRIYAIAAAALVLLAACGKKAEHTVVESNGVKVTQSGDGDNATLRATGPDGTTAVFQGGDNAKLPEGLPSFVKAYPGLAVNMSMAANSGGTNGGMFGGHSSDSVEKVASFYRDHIKSLGYGNTGEQNMGDSVVLSASDDAKHQLAVTVTKAEAGGADVVVNYSEPAT